MDVEESGDFSVVQEITSLKEPFDKLWEMAIRLFNTHEKWMNGPILQVDAEQVEQEVQSMWKLSYKLTKQFKTPDLKGPLKVAVTIKTRLEKFKINIPLIQVICNPGLKQRHWDQMNEIIDSDITPNEKTCLKDILKYNKLIEKNLDKLSEISALASKEYALEQALKKMKHDWEMMNFSFIPYKDTNMSVLASFDDVQALLEDHIVKTATMKNSPFVAPFEKEVTEWGEELVRT